MKGRPPCPRWVWFFYSLVVFCFYAPLLVIFWGAFTRVEGDSWQFTSHWFEEVFRDEHLLVSLANSLVVGFISSLASTFLGTMAAIGLVKHKNFEKFFLEKLAFLSLFLPEIVMALSLLSWFFVLQFQLSLMTVILAHISFTLSYVILTVGARLSQLEKSLEDAASDLGAFGPQILWNVTLPLLKPAIVGGFILGFLISFDDFLITFFVNGVGSDTLPVNLYSAIKLGLSPKLHALSVLMLGVTLALILLFFRKSGFHALIEGNEKQKSS